MKKINPDEAPALDLTVPSANDSRALDQPAAQSFDIEGMFKYALDKAAGPESMTTLMNIRRELNAEASKKAFDEALSAFQAECPVITKTRGVPLKGGGTAYKFAPIEKIEEIIRPIERKHGFTHTFDTDVTSAVGFVIAKCIVTHNRGHMRESVIKLPLGVKTQIMSDTQVHAGAMTFANRRALANVYGLVFAGEDIDGADKPPRPQGPSSAPQREETKSDDLKTAKEKLWALLKPIVSQAPNWNKKTWDGHNAWLHSTKIFTKPESKVETLPVEDILEIIEKAEIIIGEM